MNQLAMITREIYLQGTYLDELCGMRQSASEEFDIKKHANESSTLADTAFQTLIDDYGTAYSPLEDIWKKIRASRAEILLGRDVLKNRELVWHAMREYMQELRAERDVLAFNQSECASKAHIRGIALFALLFLSVTGLVCWYCICIVKPLRNLSTMIAVLNPSGHARSASMSFPEIADIKEDMNALNVKERESTGARDNFFASMSHEIRTPLNGIIGFLGSLSETSLNAQQKQYLNVIESSSRSLLHVIDELLDFSKINAGKLELELVAFDLASLMEDRAAVAGQLAKQQKNVKLIYDGPGEKPLIVRSDPMRLRQVIDNLLSNAVKFTDHGEIKLIVKAVDEADNRVRISITVSDTGIGIAQPELDSLFKPYVQASKDTSRRYGGTGLGLAISSNIVQLLGGNLTVRSRLGEGSIFSFEFISQRAKQEEQLRLSGNFHVTLPMAEIKKKFALLVDDTPTNLFLLETICQSVGLPYRTAQNGLEALKLCQEENFDIIFMDIQMPVMDGYTSMKEIRNLPSSAVTHIVALTASAYQEDVSHALESGANSFIPKPFERDQLLLCIADALGITPQRILSEPPEAIETIEESTVRHMHDFMREQYRISLGEIKMILAQTAVDWRPILDSLSVFAKKGQMAETKAILHKLKGQLSSIGLPELADLALKSMEQIDRNEPVTENIQQLISTLRAIFKTLEKQVTIIGKNTVKTSS